jgi:hypothetical protein
VTVDTALPAGPRLYSFIVTATVTQGTTQLRARIRVHVHDHVTAKWLTPSSLTVRQGATGMRFSVLATFDDGVIGDITNWAPLESTPAIPGDRTCVHAVGSDAPAHRWSAGTGSDIGMTVDPVTGEIRSQQPGGFVTVNLIDAGGTAASATAFAAPPWSTPVQLRRVAGLGFPALPRTDIHNVLFIPDGFVQDILGTDRLEYELYVNELVHQMNTNAQTRPYDVLSEKFNYFSAWVPSPQAGVSAMAEMFSVDPPDPNNHHVRGWDVDTPRHPLPGPEPFTVNELIDLVGLPTPANDPPGSPVGTDAAGRVHDWHQVNSAQVTAARVPAVDPEDVYNLWLAQNTRVLVNERDTAFHVAAGSRPRIDLGRTAEVELGFHPLRLTSADFNTFLKALQDDQGNPLPPVWAEGGKDDRFVVIICRTTRHSGQNNGRGAIRADGRGAAYLCVPVGSTFTRTYVAAGKGFDLVPDPIPAKVDPGPWAIMAHELAHSFGLGDEYAYPGRLHEGEGPEVQKYTNLQESAALHTPNGRLVATNIKWRLKRLRQAGVLRAEQPNVDPVRPDPSSAGRFVITLRRGHAAAFVDPQADVVRLRTPGPRTNPRYSDRLRLVGVRGNQLTVRPL